MRGWRGQAPRQPGQIRKEAAVTSPAWVVVQPLTVCSPTIMRVIEPQQSRKEVRSFNNATTSLWPKPTVHLSQQHKRE